MRQNIYKSYKPLIFNNLSDAVRAPHGSVAAGSVTGERVHLPTGTGGH
jgi:hypothetical protein